MSGERGGQVVGDIRSLSFPCGSVESLRLVGTTCNWDPRLLKWAWGISLACLDTLWQSVR
jgi:hypothetical protein